MKTFLLRFLLSTLTTSLIATVDATGWSSYGSSGSSGISGYGGSSGGGSWGGSSSSYHKPSYWSSSSFSNSRPHQITRNGYSSGGGSHGRIRPTVIIKPVLIPYAVVPAHSSPNSYSSGGNSIRHSSANSYSRAYPSLPNRYDDRSYDLPHYHYHRQPSTSAPYYPTSTSSPTSTPAPASSTTNASVPIFPTPTLPQVVNPTLDCGVSVVGLRRYRHAQSCDRYWQCPPPVSTANNVPVNPNAFLVRCPQGTTFDLDFMFCLAGGRCSLPALPLGTLNAGVASGAGVAGTGDDSAAP